jgi:hypothetical protein
MEPEWEQIPIGTASLVKNADKEAHFDQMRSLTIEINRFNSFAAKVGFCTQLSTLRKSRWRFFRKPR